MEVKTLEIRDRTTFIPALAIRLGPRDERDRWLCERARMRAGLLEKEIARAIDMDESQYARV